MKIETIQKLIKVNNIFYQTQAKQFSVTRQYPWFGWNKILRFIFSHFKDKKNICLLDIACGNGRFYRFLKLHKLTSKIKYLGIDNSLELLKEAKNLHKERFLKLDVITGLDRLNKKFDIIAIFGFIQHIPSMQLRKLWFSKVVKLLKKNGMLVFNIWEFLKISKIASKLTKDLPQSYSILINPTHMEQNDFFIPWGKEKKFYRYYHHFDMQELKELEEFLKLSGLYVAKDFCIKTTFNHYYIICLL